MKKILFLSLPLILGILSCNINDSVNPTIENQTGKLLLQIDKVNAPENVVIVEATITREGYDDITASLNLLTDSTADVLLEEVAAGEWHLKVDAKDSLDQVLYTGETDVTVLAGFTTPVYLVLEPTGQGTGSIYIYVTWGQPTHDWTDFANNPVLGPSGSYYETQGVGQANILFINGVYRMWYLGDAGGNHNYVMYAESNDGINWTRPYSDPVLNPGEAGSWDDLSVHPGAMIYDNGQYYMFYCGWSDTYGPWHIGLATSTDGINWVKYPDPVLYATGGWEYQLTTSTVIKVNNEFYLYYTGRNLPYQKIGLATSQDGITWTRNSGNPILTHNLSWEGTAVYYPSVYKENNQYVMIYMNSYGTGFGKAYSSDAINWTKDNSNPFFTKDETYSHWAGYKIAYPFYIKSNNKERIYYTGFNSYGSPYKMGLVTK